MRLWMQHNLWRTGPTFGPRVDGACSAPKQEAAGASNEYESLESLDGTQIPHDI